MKKVSIVFWVMLIALNLCFNSCQSQIKFNSAEQEADSIAINMRSANERVKNEWVKTINLYNQRNTLANELINIVDKSTNGTSTEIKDLATSLNNYKLVDKSVNLLTEEELFSKFSSHIEDIDQQISKVFIFAQKININHTAFQEIQTKLEDKANKITIQRKRFNEEAQSYNIKIKKDANTVFLNKYPELGLKNYFKQSTEQPVVKF